MNPHDPKPPDDQAQEMALAGPAGFNCRFAAGAALINARESAGRGPLHTALHPPRRIRLPFLNRIHAS